MIPFPSLQYPPADRTSRPDIPVADAYLIDDELDSEVVDSDYFTLPFACDVEPGGSVTPLVTLASFDHGLRTADETALVIGVECAAEVLDALMTSLRTIGLVHEHYHASYVPWQEIALGALGIDITDDPTSGLGWCDDPDDSQSLYEWSNDMMSVAGSAGLIVESSGDAGMTWIYAPLCAPITGAERDESGDDVESDTGSFIEDEPRGSCQYPSATHSDDITHIYHGSTTPTVLCGFHASWNLNDVLRVVRAWNTDVPDVDHPTIPVTHSEIIVGTRYRDSSGDYRVTDVFRFVWGTQVRIVPDDFRGTPGRADRHDFTVKPGSLVLRGFYN